MNKYDELAQAIVDFDPIGYCDSDDAESALGQVAKAIRVGDIDLACLCVDYNRVIAGNSTSDHERELAERVVRLADDVAWDRFVTRANTYRALGYRIVAFERECEGGWIMAFNTHGVDATELPKSAFAIPVVNRWCELCGWGSVTDDDVLIFDETDDLEFIRGSYDYYCDFPVLNLATA